MHISDISLDSGQQNYHRGVADGRKLERQRIYGVLDTAVREQGVLIPCGLQVAINLIAVPERQAEYAAPVVS